MKRRYLVTISLLVFTLIFWGLTRSISRAPALGDKDSYMAPEVDPAESY